MHLVAFIVRNNIMSSRVEEPDQDTHMPVTRRQLHSQYLTTYRTELYMG